MADLTPPGQFIDVDGVNFHYVYSRGEAPTVILESGWGSDHLSWALVQPEIAKFASILSYDRAGMGWSGLFHKPRTHANIVADLAGLLDAIEAPAPYILVGHSFGGDYVRNFAMQHPEKVGGIITVDSIPNFPNGFPEEARDQFKHMLLNTYPKMQEMTQLTHEEIVAQIKSDMPANAVTFERYPADVQARIWDRFRPEYFQARVHEFELQIEILENNVPSQAFPDLGDLPVTVLYCEPKPSPQYSDEINARLMAFNEKLWQDFASSSANSRLIMVKDSGHRIQADQPQTVIDAIQDMVEIVKSRMR